MTVIQHQHNHQHNYGVGRLLRRGYMGFVYLFLLWCLVVLVFSFAKYFIISAAIVIAAVIITRWWNRV